LLNEYAASHIEPVLVELPPLTDGATRPMRDMAAFFALVHGLRLWACDERPVPFACGWVASKLGLPKQTVWRVRGALVEAGVLVHAGMLPGRGKRGTWSFLPGGSQPGMGDVEGREVPVRPAIEPAAHLGDEPLVVGTPSAVWEGPFATPAGGTREVQETAIGHGDDPTPTRPGPEGTVQR
jgi:hypothetical protein